MASVSLQNVTKVFDRRVVAVSGLTLEIPDGQFMVLVGPSGCGKTTTLRLIAGLEVPTEGAIHIADRAMDGVSPRDRDVAMVFQDGALYPHMDVYGNMAFALRMQKRPDAEVRQRVTAAAEMLGIGDLLRRKPAALSGGQRRRVALGRAVVRDPAVFLLDEPLSSLDAQLRLTLRSELKGLHERLGATVLCVTHDQAEAMALGRRICVLQEGRVQQVGSPETIYDRPANRFVAGFFGTPPMNFLPAQVRSLDGSVSLVVGNGSVDAPEQFKTWLAKKVGQAVLIGVRPHDLSLEPMKGQASNTLSGRITLIEPLGAGTNVHVILKSGETCIVAACPRPQIHPGEDVCLHLDPDRLHFFESDAAGRRIESSCARE